MNKPTTISSAQMTVLFLSSLTGSAALFMPQAVIHMVNNAAWPSILLALGGGFIFLAVMLYLFNRYPGLTYIEYCRAAVGRVPALFVGILYISHLFLLASFLTRDSSSFFVGTMMRDTPLYVFTTLLMVVSMLTARAGIEVMGRMFVILLSLMFACILFTFVFALPSYDWKLLFPVFPQGPKPLAQGTYYLSGFPYAELPMFAMLLSCVHKEERGTLGKWLFTGLTINGIVLLASILCTIMAFGPLAGERIFSLYELAKLIKVTKAVERIESVIAIALIFGSFMKLTIILYSLNLALCRFCSIRDEQILLAPISLLCLLYSLTAVKHGSSLAKIFTVWWPFIDYTFLIIPMFLVAGVTFIRRRMS